MKLHQIVEGITWGPGERTIADVEFLIDNSVDLPTQVLDLLNNKHHSTYGTKASYKPGMANYKRPNDKQILVTANPRTADKARQDDKPVIYHSPANVANTIRMIENPTADVKYSIDLDDEGLPIHPTGPYPSVSGAVASPLQHDIPEFGSEISKSGELKPTESMTQLMSYLERPAAQNALMAKNYKVPGSSNAVKVVSVLPSSDEFKYILSSLKQASDVYNIDVLYKLMAMFCLSYFKRNREKPIQLVVCPASSSPWAKSVADLVSSELNLAEPVIYHKNTNPDSIVVNKAGAAQASKSWLASGTPVVDPITKKPMEATPENVEICWKNWGKLFASGQKKLKDMDHFVRRGNLFNLYTPPGDIPPLQWRADMSRTASAGKKERGKEVGKHVLVIDDLTTFGMTITNIAKDLYDKGAGLVSGFTYYSSKS